MAESVFDSDWLYRVVYREIEKQSRRRLQRPNYYAVIRQHPFDPNEPEDSLPRAWLLEQHGLRSISADECASHVKKCRGIYPCLLFTFAISQDRHRVRIGYRDTAKSGMTATYFIRGSDDDATLERDESAGFTIH